MSDHTNQAAPTEPAVKMDPKQQITQLWLSEPDAAAFLGEWFVPDKQTVLQHIAAQNGQVYSRLPRVLSCDADVIDAVLKVDASQIDNILVVLLDRGQPWSKASPMSQAGALCVCIIFVIE